MSSVFYEPPLPVPTIWDFLPDPYQAKWIVYTRYILFIFSSIFTILAILSFPDDRLIEMKKRSE